MLQDFLQENLCSNWRTGQSLRLDASRALTFSPLSLLSIHLHQSYAFHPSVDVLRYAAVGRPADPLLSPTHPPLASRPPNPTMLSCTPHDSSALADVSQSPLFTRSHSVTSRSIPFHPPNRPHARLSSLTPLTPFPTISCASHAPATANRPLCQGTRDRKPAWKAQRPRQHLACPG
jgi:hypothetical protein